MIKRSIPNRVHYIEPNPAVNIRGTICQWIFLRAMVQKASWVKIPLPSELIITSIWDMKILQSLRVFYCYYNISSYCPCIDAIRLISNSLHYGTTIKDKSFTLPLRVRLNKRNTLISLISEYVYQTFQVLINFFPYLPLRGIIHFESFMY